MNDDDWTCEDENWVSNQEFKQLTELSIQQGYREGLLQKTEDEEMKQQQDGFKAGYKAAYESHYIQGMLNIITNCITNGYLEENERIKQIQSLLGHADTEQLKNLKQEIETLISLSIQIK